MGSMKHEKALVDFEKGYEENEVGLKGVVYFGIGLLLLILITFGLMWALSQVLEEHSKETKSSNTPLALGDKERLPPEPRLQAAPGFAIDGDNGKVNLELKVPQAEYWELKKQWDKLLKEGRKDKTTGVVTVMPIDQAKDLLLTKNVKAKSDDAATKLASESSLVISDSSAGRRSTLKRK